MSAAFPQTTLRWILRCLLAFCLSTPITSAISPSRWDYPSTLGLARSHGLSILKYSLHTTSSVRSSDTSAEPFTASDDRTSIVTAFLRLGFARFPLLNGGTTESVVGTSINFFSARLLRDLGLYNQINSVEFQLSDANDEQIAMSTESLISQSPFRFGPVPTAIPRLLARVSSAQLHFLAEVLGHPAIADGCPPVPAEDEVFTPLGLPLKTQLNARIYMCLLVLTLAYMCLHVPACAYMCLLVFYWHVPSYRCLWLLFGSELSCFI